jgi:hypothetical protein
VLLRAGPASQLDPFLTARSLTRHQVTQVYVLYGGAAVVTVVLLVFAGLSGRLAARRRARGASGAKEPVESGR